jgi:hypothetical protein
MQVLYVTWYFGIIGVFIFMHWETKRRNEGGYHFFIQKGSTKAKYIIKLNVGVKP